MVQCSCGALDFVVTHLPLAVPQLLILRPVNTYDMDNSDLTQTVRERRKMIQDLDQKADHIIERFSELFYKQPQ